MKQKQWDELKRLHEAATPAPWRDDNGYRAYAGADDEKWLFETKHSDANGFDSTFIVAMRNALPAILAEREAAQRLRDAVLHHFGTEGVKQWKNIADAIAAFDKETQNEG